MRNNINTEELVEKYLQGKCTPEELKELLIIFENPYHNLALRPILYEKWIRQENDTGIKLDEKDKSLIIKSIHNNIQLNQKRGYKLSGIQKKLKVVTKIAAILITGIMLGIFIQKYINDKPLQYTSIAPKGSISQMILPDKSIVYLNSGSQIKHTINNISGSREVFLEGEAWFEVEESEKKPFIVHTPFYSVKVLGTQFNVKAYETDKEIVTTLEEGSIEVFLKNNLKVPPMALLKPGQQLVYNKKRKTFHTATVRPHLFTSWKENKLIFINMNLKELIVLLERKYGVDIMVSDDTVLDYHYDGTIENESIIEMLNLLKETLPIVYRIEGQKVIIKNKLKKKKSMEKECN